MGPRLRTYELHFRSLRLNLSFFRQNWFYKIDLWSKRVENWIKLKPENLSQWVPSDANFPSRMGSLLPVLTPCYSSLIMHGRDTECVTDIDEQSQIIIFKSLLTTFEASVIFEAAELLAKIGLSLTLTRHNYVSQSKAFPKSRYTLCIILRSQGYLSRRFKTSIFTVSSTNISSSLKPLFLLGVSGFTLL